MRSKLALALVSASTVVTGAVASAGCSTVYTPRPTGHVALVMEGGAIKYAKNGQSESLGFFGGGLVDAVQGNPAAEDEARSYRNLNIAGFATVMGGAASVVGGSVLLVDAARNDAAIGTGLGLMIAGLVASIVGDCLIVSAMPHFYDALNIYNDGVDAQRYGPPPLVPYAYPPPGAVPMPAPGPAPAAPAPGGAPVAAPSTGAPPTVAPPPNRPSQGVQPTSPGR